MSGEEKLLKERLELVTESRIKLLVEGDRLRHENKLLRGGVSSQRLDWIKKEMEKLNF